MAKTKAGVFFLLYQIPGFRFIRNSRFISARFGVRVHNQKTPNFQTFSPVRKPPRTFELTCQLVCMYKPPSLALNVSCLFGQAPGRRGAFEIGEVVGIVHTSLDTRRADSSGPWEERAARHIGQSKSANLVMQPLRIVR